MRRPLRAEDALFLHTQTPLLCQQVGAVVLLGAGRPGASGFTGDEFRATMAERLRAVPELCRRLERPRGRWRRPGWVGDGEADAGERIREVTVGREGAPGAFSGVVDAFFTDQRDPYHRPWEMKLVRGLQDSRTAVLVKVHFGALALVQPLLVFNLLFAVAIALATRRRHHAPDRIMLVGVLCSAAGIASFLAVGRPGGGHKTVALNAALPLMASLTAVLAACLAGARWGPGRLRAIWLATACGVDFGVTAFLLKVVPDMLPQGFGDPLRQWPLYLVVIVGPLGFLLNQSAFQAGRLIAPVLAIITALDPLVSIGIARVWLDESFASSPIDLAVAALSLTVMTGGIIALAHRAPQVAGDQAVR